MRTVTAWVSAAVVAMLAIGSVRAQQPEVGAITPEYVAGLPVRQGEREVERLVREIEARIEKACPTAEAAESCARMTALAAFGNDPLLQQHCPLLEYQECILVGSEVIAMLGAIGADPENEVNWSSWQASFDRAEDLMTAHVDAQCTQEQVPDLKACMTMRAVEVFGASPEAARRCAAQNPADRYVCITHVRAAYLYGMALARLPQ